MGESAIALGPFELAVAASMILAAGAVNAALGLGLTRQLIVASLRTIIQLLLVGSILRWVFAVDEAWILFGVLLIMIAMAARAAVKRPSRRYVGASGHAFITLLLTGLLTTFTVTGLVIGVDPWYRPQYVVPLLGMVLGNSLTGISLCLDALLESLDEKREVIEMELALGASRWEAVRRPLEDAVRRGMIPIINSMMVVGIVSIPGMMTGQILAGADPFEAVKYQIVVMFMIAAASSIGSVGVALLGYRRLFNDRHQLKGALILRR